MKKRGHWIAVLILLAWPAEAQTVCGKRADIVGRLAAGYGEVQSSAGIAANGDLVEVFASKKGGWSILFTRPDGITCMMAVGEYWWIVENPFAIETLGP